MNIKDFFKTKEVERSKEVAKHDRAALKKGENIPQPVSFRHAKSYMAPDPEYNRAELRKRIKEYVLVTHSNEESIYCFMKGELFENEDKGYFGVVNRAGMFRFKPERVSTIDPTNNPLMIVIR